MIIPASAEVRTQLGPLLEADLGELAGFISAQSGRDRASIESHLRWFLLENPARRPEDPVGFGLRSVDQLAGCILLSPQMFRFGCKDILLMGSSSFYVDEHYRGQGGRIFLQYCRLARQHPLFGTSANAEAAGLWKAAGARPISFSEQEYLGILNWPPVAEELAYRRDSSRAILRFAAGPAATVASLLRPLKIDCSGATELTVLSSAEQVSDLALPDCPAKLTAVRNSAYLQWRYFSGHDSTAALFAFRTCQPEREVLVTVNLRKRGYRGQISALNVLDVYPEISAQDWPGMVRALIARYRSLIDVVVLRNLSPELQTVFSERNFQRREFDAPIGWLLDKFNLLPASEHYIVPADGDGLI